MSAHGQKFVPRFAVCVVRADKKVGSLGDRRLTPVKSGAMMVDHNFQSIGTIGGGCSEHSVLMDAYRLIGTTQSRCVHVDMSNDMAEEEGMVCGGQMKILIQGIGG